MGVSGRGVAGLWASMGTVMASLLSPRRDRGDIDLAATEPTVVVGAGASDELPTVAWLALAAGAGLLSALCGWVLVTGLVVAGWLAAEPGTLGQALTVGTELWLLANGGGATIGAVSVTLIPWGVTLLVAWLISRTAGYAARHGSPESPTVTPMVCIVTTLGYLVPLLAVGLLVGGPMAALRAGTVMLVVVAAAAAWGCCRTRESWPMDTWPAWSRAVPRAVLAALLLMFAGGAAVLATGLALNLERMTTLLAALDAGVIGNIALLVGQLAYAPNAIVWAASYAIGPGFTLGNGSIVSPGRHRARRAAGDPVADRGTRRRPGRGVAPVVAGARRRGGCGGRHPGGAGPPHGPIRRDDAGRRTVRGALRRRFHRRRLADQRRPGHRPASGLGPELVPVLVMSTSTMGLSGAICGLVLGLWRRRPRVAKTEQDPPGAEPVDDDDSEDDGVDDRAELTAPITRRRLITPERTRCTGGTGSERGRTDPADRLRQDPRSRLRRARVPGSVGWRPCPPPPPVPRDWSC